MKGAFAAAICVPLTFGVCGCSSQQPSDSDPASCPADAVSADVQDASAEDSGSAAVLPQANGSLAWTQGVADEGFAPLAMGGSVAVGNGSFSLQSVSWKTGEYWLPNEGTPCTSTSYDVEDGTALLLLRGTFDNPTDAPIDVGGSVRVRAMVDGSGAYEGWADVTSYYGEMQGEATPGETEDFVAGIPLPLGAMEGFSSAEVRIEILDASGQTVAGYCLPLDDVAVS